MKGLFIQVESQDGTVHIAGTGKTEDATTFLFLIGGLRRLRVRLLGEEDFVKWRCGLRFKLCWFFRCGKSSRKEVMILLKNLSMCFSNNPCFSEFPSIVSMIFSIAASSSFPERLLFNFTNSYKSSLFSEDVKYILGFLCSNVASSLLKIENPTLNYQVGNISDLPLINFIKKIIL